jgi:predicted ester cyclase
MRRTALDGEFMKHLRVLALTLACAVAGIVIGYQWALLRVHHRLEVNKALVRASHDSVWSQRDNTVALAEVRRLFAPHFVLHDWSGDSAGGLNLLAQAIVDNRANFPDWTERVQSVVAEGDYVAAQFVSSGTQGRDLAPVSGESPIIANKHRTVRMPEMEIYRVSDGKLAEQWDISDAWNINIQLGLFDPDRWLESICDGGAGGSTGRSRR